MPTPDFGRLRDAVSHREPDRLPLGESFVHNDIKAAFLGRPIASIEDDIEFWVESGYDYYAERFKLLELDGIVQRALERHEAHYGGGSEKTARDWLTMAGSGLVTTDAEFNTFEWPETDDFPFFRLDEAEKSLPPGMMISLQISPVFFDVCGLMGFENFCLALKYQPQLVERMFARVGQLACEVVVRVLKYSRIGMLRVPDDVAYRSGLIIDPAYLRKYVFPWYKEIGAMCKAKDVIWVFHSDGNVWQILDDIVAAGFDALHPIDPSAMDINEVHDQVGERLCLIGNIGVDFPLARGTPDDVRKEVKRRIGDLARGGGYVLSSGNSIPEYIPVENYRAMVDATLEFGKYPIGV